MKDDLKLSDVANWGKISRSLEEERFLEGPQARLQNASRLFRIGAEFIKGFYQLHDIGPCVTVFGSARFDEGNEYYQLAREVGSVLSRTGFTVMTGGGPGIMEAANRGAHEKGGRSIGCNIQLPHEQEPNKYVDKWIEFEFFFVRKLMLTKYSYGFIALPGGYGTLDEMFETATLIQTGKMRNFPLVLMGRSFWAPMLDFLRNRMIAEETISREDYERFLVTDSPEEAVAYVMAMAVDKFGFMLSKQLVREEVTG